MKIIFLSVFYPFRGGIAQFSSALFQSLKKKGNPLVLLNFKRQYPNFLFPGKTQYVEKNDKIEALESFQIIDSINPISFVKAKNFINSQQADVLLVNYWMTFFGFCQGFIAKRSKVKNKVAILHNLIPHEQKFYDKIVNRYFLKQFDGFVVMSEKVEKDLLKLNPQAKFIHLDHPNYEHFGKKIARETAREKLNLPKDKKVLLFFGLIRKYKGLDILIAEMQNLDEDYVLLVAGECYEDMNTYYNQINALNLNSRVFINNNYIPDEAVSIYFSACDLCILPYRSATQSGIVAVANYFEVPVISSNVGAFPKTINHGRDGFVFDINKINEMSEHISQYFSTGLEGQFQVNIRLKNQRLTWDFFSEELLKFIKSL